VDDLNDQLARRDRLMLRQWRRLTPEQRVREMWLQQEASWERLRRSPTGYAHFIRRNFKSRAVSAPADPHAGA
jgi:hypothetical protein